MRQDRTSIFIREAQEACRQRIREDRRGAPPDVAEILAAIEHGLFDPNFGVAKARHASGATQTAVLHFHQLFATTVQAYIIERLLQTADELIVNPRVDLGAVPKALGFNGDGARFSRWFKRWTGKTPTQRREEAREESEEEPDLETWMRAGVGALRPEEAARIARGLPDPDSEKTT